VRPTPRPCCSTSPRWSWAGTNVIENIRKARAASIITTRVDFPRLRDALPDWIESQAKAGEIRQSTGAIYNRRLVKWAYPFVLADGTLLGDLPVSQVIREQLGSVIGRVKEAGRFLAIVEGLRDPIRGYYTCLIETKVLVGPNLAADLRYLIGKGAHRKARRRVATLFAPKKAPSS
jgi:hypothetical protein